MALNIWIFAISIALIAFAIFELHFSYISGGVLPLAIASVLIVLTFYLWLLKAWARKAVKVVIALAIIISIAGTFNPFFAMDFEHFHDGASPDWWGILLRMAPGIVFGLMCFGALDKYKNEFK
jgi:hypothetical protein